MSKEFTSRQGGGQKLNRLRRKVGAVLVEFAFAIPVFLVLLYYIHDLPKQKLMRRKIQFVANEMAAIIQNIATQKDMLSQEDLVNTARLAWLSMFPGMTQYSPTNTWMDMPLGYLPTIRVYYVEGTGPNTAKIRWFWRCHPGRNSQSVYTYNSESFTKENYPGRTLIKSWSGADSSIYPTLRISRAGEVKIIVEVILHSQPEIKFSSTGKSTTIVSKRELFGFLFHNPIPSTQKFSYFNTITIFTPKGGFSKTPPQ